MLLFFFLNQRTTASSDSNKILPKNTSGLETTVENLTTTIMSDDFHPHEDEVFLEEEEDMSGDDDEVEEEEKDDTAEELNSQQQDKKKHRITCSKLSLVAKKALIQFSKSAQCLLQEFPLLLAKCSFFFMGIFLFTAFSLLSVYTSVLLNNHAIPTNILKISPPYAQLQRKIG